MKSRINAACSPFMFRYPHRSISLCDAIYLASPFFPSGCYFELMARKSKFMRSFAVGSSFTSYLLHLSFKKKNLTRCGQIEVRCNFNVYKQIQHCNFFVSTEIVLLIHHENLQTT